MLIASALVLRLIVAYTSIGIEAGFWIEDVKVISSGYVLDFYNHRVFRQTCATIVK
jgi:hypothetical protein